MKSETKKRDKVPIYMAFPDGVFHYVCRECTMVCCYRSAEFDGSFRDEIAQLVQLYPAMEITAIRRRGDVVKFATPSGRCYFLDADNRCGVEVRHGKEIKPVACRVFPFNNYYRAGRIFVVGLNFLCPLKLEIGAAPGQVEGDHARIEAHLRQSPYMDPSYIDSMRKLEVPPGLKAADELAVEAEFRDFCSESLGQKQFVETLRSATAEPGELDAFVASAGGLLNLDVSLRPATRDHIDDLLLALAPMLRLNILNLTADKRLRVLALSELVLRRLLTITGTQPIGPADASTPKGAFEILTRVAPALNLLAIADDPVRTSKQALKRLPPFGDAEMTFAAFELLRAAANGQPLFERMHTSLERLPVVDRMALLMELAPFVGQAGTTKT